jgi:hypothetical protein
MVDPGTFLTNLSEDMLYTFRGRSDGVQFERVTVRDSVRRCLKYPKR